MRKEEKGMIKSNCHTHTQFCDGKCTAEEIVVSAIEKGACGCVYTQLSDVEDEINGLYTYDRKVCKVDKIAMKEVAARINAKVNG